MTRLWYGGAPADFIIAQGLEANIYTIPSNANPYFETDVSNWTGINGASPIRSTVQFHEGVASMLVTPNGVTADPRVQSEVLEVVTGESWFADGWLRSPGTPTVGIFIRWYSDAAGSVFLSESGASAVLVADTWTYFSVTGVAPATAIRARIAAKYVGTPAAATTLFVDEALLVPSVSVPRGFGTAMLLPLASTALDAYTDAALTTPTTDLLDGSGAGIEQVTSLTEFGNRATIPRFQGPDGHEGSLWLSADGVTGFRFDPESGSLYVRVGATEDALAAAAADVTVLEADVITLDGRLDTLEARTPSPNVQVFTSNGTWNKPAGARKVFAECQGGGGAGGGCAATTSAQNSEGSGGGAGGYAAEWYDASELGSSETITVGAGGTGVSGANGNAGGQSDFGDFMFGVDGGNGGFLGAASSTALTTASAEGGSGYSNGAGIPSIIRRGGYGHPGVIIGGVAYRLAAGGSSEGSGVQRLTPATASGAGIAGIRGSGGSGARNSISQSARAGGAGGAGYVRVTTYF